MIHFLAIAVILIFPTAVNGADENVQIQILSLLSPRTIVIEGEKNYSVDVTLLGNSDRQIALHPGEQLIVKCNGEQLHVSIERTAVHFETDCSGLHISRSVLCLVVPGHEQHARRVDAELYVEPGDEFLNVSAILPFEQAVAEITAAEIGGSGVPPESLKAQAVCVRSYLLFSLAAKAQRQINDTTAHMLYRGLDGAFGPDGPLSIELGTRAARDTEGIVIAHGEYLWPAYFHACCGGRTRYASAVFGTTLPQLPYDGDSVKCAFCSGSSDYRWSWRIDAKEFAGKVFNFESVDLRFDGSNKSILLIDESGSSEYTREAFRLRVGRVFGWDALKSNVFDIKQEDADFLFTGEGAGHNVGFCQRGAIEAARRGMNWRELLKLYFPSCRPLPRDQVNLFSRELIRKLP